MEETTEREMPLSGAARSRRVDLGLALLSAVALPGVRYTQEEIAAWCGCTHGAIYVIERRALRKLRNRLLFQKDPLLRELLFQALGREL